MITLVTPHAESMHDPEGVEKAFDEVRQRVRQLAKTIALVSKVGPTPDPVSDPGDFIERTPSTGFRVLLVTRSGEEKPPAALRSIDDNPTVIHIRHMDSNAAAGSVERALEVTYNLMAAIDNFCLRAGRHKHLVVIEDADYYFYPRSEPGAFTRTLDDDVALVDQVSTIGKSLAGHDGHILIAAVLDQSPERLSEFLDFHGWSWVISHGKEFNRMCGRIPEVLEGYCHSKPAAIEPEHSHPLTIKQLTILLDKHRNTVSKWIKEDKIPVVPKGKQYRIELSYLSQAARKKLQDWERSRFKEEDGPS